jgi:hypothetical protein
VGHGLADSDHDTATSLVAEERTSGAMILGQGARQVNAKAIWVVSQFDDVAASLPRQMAA